jgi:hypothetical protein
MLSDDYLRGFRAGLNGRPSHNPQGAYDAAPAWSRRHAHDAADDSDLLAFLRDRLDPADLDEAIRLIEKCSPGLLGGGADDENEQERRDNEQAREWHQGKGEPGLDRRRRYARDEPPPFRGMPRPGGTMVDDRRHRHAMDSALNRGGGYEGFIARNPHMARIKVM